MWFMTVQVSTLAARRSFAPSSALGRRTECLRWVVQDIHRVDHGAAPLAGAHALRARAPR